MRRRPLLGGAIALVAAALVGIGVEVIALAGPQSGPFESAAPAAPDTTPNGACPATFPYPVPFGDPAAATPTGLDASILICRYSDAATHGAVLELVASGMASGDTAGTMITQIATAPAADLHQSCPAPRGEELWIINRTPAWSLQLGGCGTATDGVRYLRWDYADPLG